MPPFVLAIGASVFLQSVSDDLKCNKIGRAFNAYFERPNLTGRDCPNTYLITR
jgi:hypothetical protein